MRVHEWKYPDEKKRYVEILGSTMRGIVRVKPGKKERYIVEFVK